ncbi:MAG TPA: DUF5667 domain-containing protein, partial [Anaerolineae bacterium]|nr:DUF5667 domain-containing protein [Anaerolineae bacterium]
MKEPSENNKKLENALDYSIKLLNSGASIDDCLRMYPNQRKELKALLEAATCVKSAYPGYPQLRPSKWYAKAGRERFIAAIEGGAPPAALTAGAEKVQATQGLSIMRGIYRKAATVAAAAAAALLITTGGLVHASDSSMPGDSLYGVKRIAENAQLMLTFDSESRARLHYEFAQRRIAEARYMIKAGEQDEAARISKEAKDNLSEAKRVAKVIPPAEQDKLENAIESLGSEDAQTDGSTEAKSSVPAETTTAQGPDAKVAIATDTTSSVSDDSTQTIETHTRVARTSVTTSGSKSAASLAPFAVDSVTVSRRYISPNGDGVRDTVSIHISGATEESFSVALYKGSVKVAVIAERLSGKDLSINWNGKDTGGNRLPDGGYSIMVLSRTGQLANVKADITVDTVPPSVTLIEPPANVTTDVLKPRFMWQASDDVESYTLRLSLDGIDTELQGITNDFYLPEYNLLPGIWRWSVHAI